MISLYKALAPVFIPLFFLSSLSADTGTGLDQRMREAYEAVDRAASLSCSYISPSKFLYVDSLEQAFVRRGNGLSGLIRRKFRLRSAGEETMFTLSVSQSAHADARFEAQFENGSLFSGEIKGLRGRSFFLNPYSRNESPQEMDYGRKWQTGKILCSVDFAKNAAVEIRESLVHLNIHPHKRYDYLNLTSHKTEDYLADTAFDSFIMLEEGNKKGNLVDLAGFLSGQSYSLPKNFYPSALSQDAPGALVVSPAGHNSFRFLKMNGVKVVYTGGNHNYCIWNNTRNLLYAFLQSDYDGDLEIIYDTQAIVAQRKGIISGLSFPRSLHKRSNLLVDLFKDLKVAKKYHQAYFNYFSSRYITPFTGLFSELKISYEASAYSQTRLIKGRGERQLELTLRFK